MLDHPISNSGWKKRQKLLTLRAPNIFFLQLAHAIVKPCQQLAYSSSYAHTISLNFAISST